MSAWWRGSFSAGVVLGALTLFAPPAATVAWAQGAPPTQPAAAPPAPAPGYYVPPPAATQPAPGPATAAPAPAPGYGAPPAGYMLAPIPQASPQPSPPADDASESRVEKRRGPVFHVDGGVARRTLYEIPFWGGELRLGVGGRLGGVRLTGTATVLVAKDDTDLRLTQFMMGVQLEGHLAGPVFIGGGLDLGGASVRTRSRSPTAIGSGLTVHLGVDVAKFDTGSALYVLLRGAVHGFDGRNAPGPASTGGTLALGFRL
jgi:hypothetical protein